MFDYFASTYKYNNFPDKSYHTSPFSPSITRSITPVLHQKVPFSSQNPAADQTLHQKVAFSSQSCLCISTESVIFTPKYNNCNNETVQTNISIVDNSINCNNPHSRASWRRQHIRHCTNATSRRQHIRHRTNATSRRRHNWHRLPTGKLLYHKTAR